MSRVQIVIVAGAVMALAFVLATNIYSGRREDAIRAVAEAEVSPLERPYSVSRGPADARVVLVEFFDPACETCREYDAYVKELVAAHPGEVRLVLRRLRSGGMRHCLRAHTSWRMTRRQLYGRFAESSQPWQSGRSGVRLPD